MTRRILITPKASQDIDKKLKSMYGAYFHIGFDSTIEHYGFSDVAIFKDSAS